MIGATIETEKNNYLTTWIVPPHPYGRESDVQPGKIVDEVDESFLCLSLKAFFRLHWTC